ncbi:MAG: hypothetical protein GY805_11265 [Chloroflexi bacterium]|nr:hypothetical protein [Chloroflexota bacterium]
MTKNVQKRPPRKGVKITPHKGGRTISKRTDVTPEVNDILKWLRKNHLISLGDLVEEAAQDKYRELHG